MSVVGFNCGAIGPTQVDPIARNKGYRSRCLEWPGGSSRKSRQRWGPTRRWWIGGNDPIIIGRPLRQAHVGEAGGVGGRGADLRPAGGSIGATFDAVTGLTVASAQVRVIVPSAEGSPSRSRGERGNAGVVTDTVA